MSQVEMLHSEWQAEGRKRFGDDFKTWRFVCPICKNVATVSDYEAHADKGATPNSATNECIGRYTAPPGTHKAFGTGKVKQPCDYAGYGLFKISPILVVMDDGKRIHSFAFAEAA